MRRTRAACRRALQSRRWADAFDLSHLGGARDPPSRRARRDDERARQIDLPRPATAREIAVLRTDGDLIGGVAHARAGLDTCAAGRVHQLGARLGEDGEVALLLRVTANVLRV